MEIYLLKFTACLFIFWVLYIWLLEGQKMHHFKRFYLLGSFATALIIPALSITHYIEPIAQNFETAPINFPIETSLATSVLEEQSNIDLATVLWLIYGLGALLFSVRFIINLIRLYKSITKSDQIHKGNFIYILLRQYRIPHSFFRYIFLHKTAYQNHEIPKEVLLHEETHAKQLHSLDILLVELLQIVFWFHPLVYVLKHHIKLNHEFLADEAVLNDGVNSSSYQTILLQFSSNTQDFQLSSAINYSSFKKRFTVMKSQTSKTKKWVSSLLLLPVVAILFYSFAEREYVQKETSSESNIISDDSNASNLFLVTVEKNGNTLELRCESGCRWSHLSLSPQANPYLINDFGYTQGKTIDTDKFTFSIKPTSDGVELNGLKGTAWIDLAFTLPKNKKQAINHLGMTKNSQVSNEKINDDLKRRAEINYYTKQFFTIKNKNGEAVRKRFNELSYEDKIKWVHADEIPYTKIDVTELHFKEAKNSKDYIIKVNGNYISREELNKYKASDFITFSYTVIPEIAKMKEKSVLNLVTHDIYEFYVKLMSDRYREAIKAYEYELNLPEDQREKDIKELVSIYEFLNYNFKQFTPNIITQNNFKAPTPISQETVDLVNKSYLNTPTLFVDKDNNLFLNNKPTSLETIKRDFNKITNNSKSSLNLETEGRVHIKLVNSIMQAIGDNLQGLGITYGEVYDPEGTNKLANQQKSPTEKEVASYNLWAKKMKAKFAKMPESEKVNGYPHMINDETFRYYNSIYDRMTSEQKKNSVTLPEAVLVTEWPMPEYTVVETVSQPIQEKATKQKIVAYNKWAKKINIAVEKAKANNSYEYPIIKKKEVERYLHIYKNLMTEEQRKNAEPFPSIPPPPPPAPETPKPMVKEVKSIKQPKPPAPPKVKATKTKNAELSEVPPPPPPPSILDSVIYYAKKSIPMYFGDKEITSDEAIALVKSKKVKGLEYKNINGSERVLLTKEAKKHKKRN